MTIITISSHSSLHPPPPRTMHTARATSHALHTTHTTPRILRQPVPSSSPCRWPSGPELRARFTSRAQTHFRLFSLCAVVSSLFFVFLVFCVWSMQITIYITFIFWVVGVVVVGKDGVVVSCGCVKCFFRLLLLNILYILYDIIRMRRLVCVCGLM